MRFLLDTSVLVAGLLESHTQHNWCLSWLERLNRREIESVVCSHSLLELYSVLTRLPIRPRLLPHQVRQLVEHSLIGKVEVVGLSAEDYWQLLSWLADQRIVGGRVYDALIAQAGQQAQVEAIITLNPRHFEGLAKGIRVIAPTD